MGELRIGFIVNPIAGMGGSVGLKGTDGDILCKARTLGAKPVVPERCHAFFASLPSGIDLCWLTAPGKMGADYLSPCATPCEIVGDISQETTRHDTVRIAKAMLVRQIDLLVFVGGDGTAYDICQAVDMTVPVVAIPAGVKAYSAAFALSPRAAAELVGTYTKDTALREQEVLDIDEDAFREGRLEAHFAGYLAVPDVKGQLQPGKQGSALTPDTLETQRDIAAGFVEEMVPDTLYLLGPGTTLKALADALALPKTLLGVDAVLNRELVGMDLNEKQLLSLLDRYQNSVIVVTPLGGNGFVFGRGNKQFTPDVIKRVGPGNIVVLASPDKVRGVPFLRLDTGDAVLDSQLAGYIEVIVGYKVARIVKMVAV